jgi:hypothetical protein
MRILYYLKVVLWLSLGIYTKRTVQKKHGEEVDNKKQMDQESQAQTKDPGDFCSDDSSDKPRNQECNTLIVENMIFNKNC